MSEYVVPNRYFQIQPAGEYRVYSEGVRSCLFSSKDNKIICIDLEENTVSIVEMNDFKEYKETKMAYKHIVKRDIDLTNKNEKKLYKKAKKLSRTLQNLSEGNYINCLVF